MGPMHLYSGHAPLHCSIWLQQSHLFSACCQQAAFLFSPQRPRYSNKHHRIGWRSPTDPQNLLQLSVRQNKATPENLSLARCFSPLLFKARSRWEACFSFRVRTHDPEGSLWRGGICYLRVHNQVFHLQGPGKSVPAWTKRCDFQGTVLESSRYTTDTFQLPEEDIASAATGKMTLQTHSLLVLSGSWYTDSFWIFCTSAHYYFITS